MTDTRVIIGCGERVDPSYSACVFCGGSTGVRNGNVRWGSLQRVGYAQGVHTNKAAISFRINGLDNETHEAHKDCDNL